MQYYRPVSIKAVREGRARAETGGGGEWRVGSGVEWPGYPGLAGCGERLARVIWSSGALGALGKLGRYCSSNS